MTAIGRSPQDDHVILDDELDDGDIILFEPGNGARFIRANPDSVIDLSEVRSR